jgi:hypothetical protein
VMSWALEWNKNYRAIGYAGDPDAIRSCVDKLPPLEMMPLASSPQGTLHMRVEQRLKISDDVMFRHPAPSENDPTDDGAILSPGQRTPKSTLLHSSGNTSEAMRQPVMYANSTIGCSSSTVCRMTKVRVSSLAAAIDARPSKTRTRYPTSPASVDTQNRQLIDTSKPAIN